MSLTADMRIFARKGEAAPAGVALNQFPVEAPLATDDAPEAQSGAACADRNAGRASSNLSFLIQRRKPAVGDASEEPRKDADARGRESPARAVQAKPQRARAQARAAADGRPAGPAVDPNVGAQADDGPEVWRKLSFRVRQDQYRKLKALSGLWGASYQGILERAVAAFVDSAIGAEEADWDA
jgi:hypothetical protein